MYFLTCQEQNPDFLNNYLKYATYITFNAETSANEIFTDLRTFFRYVILINDDKLDLDTLTIDQFKDIKIKNITIEDLSKVSEKQIDDYIFFLKNFLNNCPKTRNRKLSTIKKFYKFLDKNNYISYNPTLNTPICSKGKRIPKYLNLEQSKKLLSNTINSNKEFNIRNYAIVCLFLNCCLRLSELVKINISDINFNDKTIKVNGKGNRDRFVYLNEATIEALQEYIKIRPELSYLNPDKDALFISKQNKRISRRTVQDMISNNLKESFNENSKNLHTHSLRHTGASLMYNENNTNIIILKKILGHKTLSATEIYVHVSDNKMREFMRTCTISSIIEREEKKNG